MPVKTANIEIDTQGMTDARDLTPRVADAVRAALVGPSLAAPFVNRRLTLGTWRQIVLICFDTRPRRREIVLQIMGE